jgi:hypothetical protein
MVESRSRRLGFERTNLKEVRVENGWRSRGFAAAYFYQYVKFLEGFKEVKSRFHPEIFLEHLHRSREPDQQTRYDWLNYLSN